MLLLPPCREEALFLLEWFIKQEMQAYYTYTYPMNESKYNSWGEEAQAQTRMNREFGCNSRTDAVRVPFMHIFY